MGRFFRWMITPVALLILVSGLASSASASNFLSGRWNSDSIRDNQIGYFFELTPTTQAGVYSGYLRFEYRDGRMNPKMRVRVTVNGNYVEFVKRKGTFDKAGTVLKGSMNSRGNMITFTNCQARLRLVMANALDSDCVFRPVADR